MVGVAPGVTGPLEVARRIVGTGDGDVGAAPAVRNGIVGAGVADAGLVGTALAVRNGIVGAGVVGAGEVGVAPTVRNGIVGAGTGRGGAVP